MALAPALQIHPIALFDSFSRLHPRRFHRLCYSSSSSSTTTTTTATATTKKLTSFTNSLRRQNPRPNSPPLPRSPTNHPHQSPPDDLCPKPSWLQRWSRPPQTPFHALPKRPPDVLDYRQGLSSDDDEAGTSRSTGSTTMQKIIHKLKKFGYIDDVGEREATPLQPEKGSVEDIFYVEDGILPDSRGGLSVDLSEEVRFPWEKKAEDNKGGEDVRKKRSKTSLAELTLPEGELRRVRHLAIRMKSKMKIGGAGVTRQVVDLIHEKWKTEEVVRLKCEGPPALNMKRMHEILERKTGGLVIWRSGTSISLYRGVTYEVPQPVKKQYHSIGANSLNKATHKPIGEPVEYPKDNNMQDARGGLAAPVERKKDTDASSEIKYEHEVDKLLDGLGPRYVDWPGCDPLPVDADLLPATIPGYKPPFRILPYGVRASLGLKEGTALRRLARVLPPHFAVGRSRLHDGLAAAILKLWERSSIAKIALKRGVQLTTSERMAEDIKRLTGGTLLSRNKDYLVFYRGKDFLSPEVTEALLERERLTKTLQDEEEQARQRALSSVVSSIETVEEPGTAGTLGETLEADARWGSKLDDDHENKMMRAAEMARHADLVRKLERKLYLAERKLMKAEKALAKVEEFLKPAEHITDPESITDEERFMFRKLGLRMKAFLLLGRRGVFDGTVENMHLHWKYRELVKVIVKAKTFAQVKNVALSLEAESGGVLVSVDKISKGFAIIVYRGKDYQRPPTLRPKNLLTKRKALARSIELQRHEALNRHISNLYKRVEQLRSELEQMENIKEQGDENLYAKLDAAYLSEDEDSEVEGEEAFLETFDTTVDLESDNENADSYGRDEEDEGNEDDLVDNLYPSMKSDDKQQSRISQVEATPDPSKLYI